MEKGTNWYKLMSTTERAKSYRTVNREPVNPDPARQRPPWSSHSPCNGDPERAVLSEFLSLSLRKSVWEANVSLVARASLDLL
jgi:hypothetical protein